MSMELTKLALAHGVFETTLSKKFAERKRYTPPDPNQITAFLPGVIQALAIKPAQRVKKGDRLFILEAMKMENPVFAPRDATVKTVLVRQGESVPARALLVELEP